MKLIATIDAILKIVVVAAAAVALFGLFVRFVCFLICFFGFVFVCFFKYQSGSSKSKNIDS